MPCACCCASWRDRLVADGSVVEQVVRGYSAAAARLFDSYDAIDPEQLYAPVRDLFPDAPSRFADIGAGTGRDAGWLAALGHDVVAVEPVAAFRAAGARRHDHPAITWCDDRLPDLRVLRRSGVLLGGVLLSGVWQHLIEEERRTALLALAAVAAPGAIVIISLRHGLGASNRPVIDADSDHTSEAARHCGLTLMRRITAGSVGAANRRAGVHWTWLAFERR